MSGRRLRFFGADGSRYVLRRDCNEGSMNSPKIETETAPDSTRPSESQYDPV